MHPRGALVVLTGIDGCGKTTQVEHLVRWLRLQGRDAEAASWRVEDVSGQLVGDIVARIAKKDVDLPPRTAALLLAANASYRMERQVAPAVAAGRVLVEDDSAYKMMARAAAAGLPASWTEGVFGFLPRPDAGVLLDLAPEDALARIGGRVTLQEAGLDADRRAGFLRHQAAVRAELRRLAARDGFAVVDAAQGEAVVADAVRAAVARALGLIA